MPHIIAMIAALNLHPDMEKRLHDMIGVIATTAHALGYSPTDEVDLIELVLQFTTEVRDGHKVPA
jgi:hypothetical protein